MRGKKVIQINELTDDAIKYVDLINQHLAPCGDDLILLTLKGHLIIENLLEINLARLLAIDHIPDGKNNPDLEFNQKLILVQAAVLARDVGPNADLFCVIAKLNKIRNDLAHSLLIQQEVEAKIKSLIASYQSKADAKLDSNVGLPMQLKNCIVKLCQFLLQVRIHFYKLGND